MTLHRLPPTPDVPESSVSELHALYREGSGAEPSLKLDQRIIAAARDELRESRKLAKRPMPWWKRWLAPTTAVAVALIGLSLTWRVVSQQENDLRAVMGAGDA